MKFRLRTIGRVKTPYRTLGDCPRNIDPKGPVCELLIDQSYVQGLAGLGADEHILVLYWLDEADREALLQKRWDSGREIGVFALRSPNRPNPIGAAVVKIESVDNGCIRVRGMDCLDGTPMLDIKPAQSGERGLGGA